MSQNMSKEELIDLVEKIMTVYDKENKRNLSEEEHTALLVKFKKGIKHPGGTDLIYYPQLVGLPPEPTVEQIVDLAMK